jgi:predicted secreted protein
VKTFPAAIAVLGFLAAACGRDSRAAPHGREDLAAPASPRPGDCSHAVCGSNFFVDATPSGDCAAGGTCSLSLQLVATGDFHINDEYPYRFKADDGPGVEFLGTDAAGTTVFSKQASNWKKKDEKNGVMTVAFRAAEKGTTRVGGTFKLSVCSAQACQLEQQPVRATVAVR